ncbi:MAG: ATP-binding cassette domain-containing protein [Spirochaetaceae bacterium]|nr:ATP-binding cassette domain-containing protein [Spirochaetaceae bacterium]
MNLGEAKFTRFFGENGAGKSTLMHILSGFHPLVGFQCAPR